MYNTDLPLLALSCGVISAFLTFMPVEAEAILPTKLGTLFYPRFLINVFTTVYTCLNLRFKANILHHVKVQLVFPCTHTLWAIQPFGPGLPCDVTVREGFTMMNVTPILRVTLWEPVKDNNYPNVFRKTFVIHFCHVLVCLGHWEPRFWFHSSSRAQHKRVRDRLSRLGVRIMVWVGTSLLTRRVVFQWASTMKTGRRSD